LRVREGLVYVFSEYAYCLEKLLLVGALTVALENVSFEPIGVSFERGYSTGLAAARL
jgi:hypothetical protein